MNAVRFPILVLLFAALATGCAAISVETDYDPDADFTGIKTWNWSPKKGDVPDDPRFDSEFMHSRIQNAVTDTLTAKGFTQQADGMPDILIGYHVIVEDKVDVSTVDNHYGWQGGSWYYTPVSSRESYVRQYQVGTLLVDLADGKSKRLLWRGSAKAEIMESATPQKREERLREAVNKMFAEFPPQK